MKSRYKTITDPKTGQKRRVHRCDHNFVRRPYSEIKAGWKHVCTKCGAKAR